MDTEIPSIEHEGTEGRPYRSHRHPACLPCRARKSRCKTRDASSSSTCDMCQAHGSTCVFPQVVERPRIPRRSRRDASSKERHTTASSHTQAFRMRCLSSNSPTLSQRSLPSYTTSPNVQRTSTNESITDYPEGTYAVAGRQNHSDSALLDIIVKSGEGSSHVVSPAIADDDRVFQEYLFSNASNSQSKRMVRFHLNLNNPSQYSRPILFNTVPKRGKRETESRSLSALNCEIIEKIIHPYQDELVNIFFEKINMPFPIFDELLFRRVFMTNKEKISSGLLSTLYGNTMIYWDTSPKLKNVPCPDVRTIWVQAENALNTELISTPGISTIISIILHVAGRPSSHRLNNGGLLGMAVALANAFGLNRDPSDWNLSPSEKKFRIRIWWLLVVYDRWCSLGYGTPPLIHRTQHDIPVLTAEDLYNQGASNDQILASSCFVALTTLTEVLGHCLEQVYHLGSSKTEDTSPFDLENLLTRWEDSLNDDIRRLVIRGTKLIGPGAANLRLSYLSVKLLIRRSQLDWARVSLQIDDIDSQYYVQARRASEEIVDFVRELDESHLHDFWIPLNAYSLTSATTFLLRCALNSRGQARNSPLKLAKAMIEVLQSHRRNHAWDLADNCLSNCSDLVEKIETAYEESSLNTLEFEELMPMDMDMDMDIAALNDLFP